MTHIPEHGCPKCRIDGGFTLAVLKLFVSTILRHSARLSNAGNAHDAAILLADTLVASMESTQVAIESGIISPESASAHSFEGCHRATEIIAWVDALRRGPSEAERVAIDGAAAKMEAWAIEEHARTRDLVSGASGKHDHDDLLGK